MTTEVRIKVLSLDYRLRRQIVDEVNSRYVLIERESKSKYVISLGLDMNDVKRENIINSLSEGVLEYVDTIDVFNSEPEDIIPEIRSENPFKTADTLL